MTVFRRVFVALILAVLLAPALSNCSSRYVRNRVRDAGDIFTLEGTTRAYGVSARVGPLKAGLYYKSPQGASKGLRGGHAGSFHSAEFTVLLFGADYLSQEPLKDLLPKKKPAATKDSKDGKETKDAKETKDGKEATSPKAESPLPAKKGPLLMRLRGKEFRASSPFGTRKTARHYRSLLKDKDVFVSGYYFTQIEISLGLYLGVKIGFNPGELLDFLLGFIGIDLYGDDEPFPDPRLEKLKKSPYFRGLSAEEQKRMLREYEKNKGTLPIP